MRRALDEQIADTLQVISVLLVFFFAYFSYAVSRYTQLSEERQRVEAKLNRRIEEYASCRKLLCLALLATIPLVSLLTPLFVRVVQNWIWSNAVRTGLSLVYASILAIGAAVVLLIRKANRSIANMRQTIATEKKRIEDEKRERVEK
ncbi:hypothetical protein QCN29_36130 [Streptomyces sp. HNM0663]|uniref:Uncharacterized protein n=1 Tax=Streptomyces chengmaiensis TaxID=3040919 RepID=A0ABT6HZG7_9ACTN|nr:hypothetical protein [Streptomyces chengmaiensis]MDH2394077.1 hypothetical protein [Streptomyces chengmaiensis]